MRVQKYVTKTQVQELIVNSITLLPAKVFEECGKRIPLLETYWWLRDAGETSRESRAMGVYYDGTLDQYGTIVKSTIYAVRPALEVNQTGGDWGVGDKFRLFGYDWTIISDRYALCDSSIGTCCFREDDQAEDADQYEASDVKKFVEKWLEEQQAK